MSRHLFVYSVLFIFQDVFVLVTPVVEYDSDREKDFDRASKRQTLAYLFPDPTPVNDVQDRNSLWGQYKVERQGDRLSYSFMVAKKYTVYFQ